MTNQVGHVPLNVLALGIMDILITNTLAHTDNSMIRIKIQKLLYNVTTTLWTIK